MSTSVKRYVYKFREHTGKRFLVRYIDKRDEMPKSEPTVLISGLFTQEATLTIAAARELESTIHTVLRGIKTPDVKSETKDE